MTTKLITCAEYEENEKAQKEEEERKDNERRRRFVAMAELHAIPKGVEVDAERRDKIRERIREDKASATVCKCDRCGFQLVQLQQDHGFGKDHAMRCAACGWATTLCSDHWPTASWPTFSPAIMEIES